MGLVVIPSGTGMEAGPGAAVSAHVSHPPSRSGWLDEAITLLGSAGRSPGRSQGKAGLGFSIRAFSAFSGLSPDGPEDVADSHKAEQQRSAGTSFTGQQ